MAKKLTVEVDAETSKAKRKIQGLAESGGSSGPGGPPSPVTPAAAGAAKSLDRLGKSASEGSANLRAMTKVFGGMAVRMATSYAAQRMEEGSAGRVAVDAGGAAVAGALQGSVAGPLGALAGAVMGLTQSLMEASAQEAARKNALQDVNMANREQLETLLKAEQRTEKFKATLDALTNAEDGGVRRMEARALLDEKRRALALNADELTGQSGKFDGDDKKFRAALAERSTLKSEIAQLESLLDRKDPKKPAGGPSMSFSALDSLSRVGGNFAGGDQGFRDLQRVNEKQVAILEKIEAKTGKGAGKF